MLGSNVTRIVAHLVMRNEEHRFLDSCLAWNSQWFDELHVYDDRSTDASVNVAAKYTDKLTIRPENEVAFSEHEGEFRQRAWNDLESRCDMQPGDFVFALDADEFLVGNSKDSNPRASLETLVTFVNAGKHEAASILRPEVWDTSGVVPKIRIDGFWGADRVPRFVRWKPKGKIQDVRLGCGSIPTYGLKGPAANIQVVNLLHFGYTIENEAQRKYDLYKKTEGNTHNPVHINSLIEHPTLSEWGGPVPKFWRGNG